VGFSTNSRIWRKDEEAVGPHQVGVVIGNHKGSRDELVSFAITQ
jgi:hypothetical protein